MKKDVNIMNIGHYVYGVDWEDLTEEYQNEIDKNEYVENNHGVPYDAVKHFRNNLYFEYYEEVLYDYLNANIKKYPYYLVVSKNGAWGKRTGFKIIGNILDAFVFNYDVSMYFQAQTKGRKTYLFKKHSHNVPMGHDYIVIGLTEKECKKLKEGRFEPFIEWAERKTKKLLEEVK
jgi:hypothetical protein